MGSLITVVVPIYNSASYIPTFFACLRRQTFKSFSVLIVYDKSADSTKEILDQCIQNSPSLSCQIIEKPFLEGVGKARDFALDSGLVASPYVIFVDCDDYFSPLYLERLYSKAIDSSADITMCGFKRVDGNDEHVISVEMVHNPPEITNLSASEILPYLNPAPWNKLIKTSLIGDARFVHKGGGEDLMFFLKLLPKTNKIAFLNEPLYIYKVNPGSKAAGTDTKMLDEAKNGYLETRDFYFAHGEKYIGFLPLLDTFVFIRLGIGLTTRVCLTKRHGFHPIIRDSKLFMNSYFPGWKKSRFLSFRVSRRHGIKSLMIWACRCCYKCGTFGLFVTCYRLYTKMTKKDIKW